MAREADEVHLLRGSPTAPVPRCGAFRVHRGTWQPELVTCDGCLRAMRRAAQVTQPIDPSLLVPERDFQGSIVALARRCGFLAYHTHDSRRSAAGYPDLTLVHPERHIGVWLELKSWGKEPTVEQRQWLHALNLATQWEARVITPDDWSWVVARLQAP